MYTSPCHNQYTTWSTYSVSIGRLLDLPENSPSVCTFGSTEAGVVTYVSSSVVVSSSIIWTQFVVATSSAIGGSISTTSSVIGVTSILATPSATSSARGIASVKTTS